MVVGKRIMHYFCKRFKGQILPSISVILIRKGASIESPCTHPRAGKEAVDVDLEVVVVRKEVTVGGEGDR